MTRRLFIGLILLGVLVGCTPLATPGASPVPQGTPSPTATLDVLESEVIGRAFLNAWQQANYPAMYELVAPARRATLDQAGFESAYRNALMATGTVSMTITPQRMILDGERGRVEFSEAWHTALFGTLESSNTLYLVKNNGRWWVDWDRAAIWPDLAGDLAFAVDYQTPPRANIYDREGAGLAVPSTIVTVGVVPERIQDEAAVLEALSYVLNQTPESIRARYAGQPASWFIPIGEIDGDTSLSYNTLLSRAGIERRERTGRGYPLGGVAAHIVGWIAPIPQSESELYHSRGYQADALVGVAGLEAWGEAILAGRNGGRLYLVDADGAYVRTIAERRPQRGHAIYTTLNRAWQAQAESLLRQTGRGAAVALDVKSGAVLMMASSPGFDNNAFLNLAQPELRQVILNDPSRPLLNRATQGTYPAGSTFKIVTMVAALEGGGFTPESTFYCGGYWDRLGSANRKACWTAHGALTLQDALIQSCNTTFYDVGLRLDSLDPNLLPSYARAFGLGQLTGIQEIPEVAGLVPDADWKFNTLFERWTSGDSVNLAIGQGHLLVTPLQMARMMAAIANGGTLYRPYLVDRVVAADGQEIMRTQRAPTGQIPISAAHLESIRAALLAVTQAPMGTATHRFQGLTIPVAGKTGTAEAPGVDAKPHSWFVGYFPADDPQIAMAVVVENAGEGSTVAAPLFRQLVEAYYGMTITPLPTPVPEP